MPRPAPPQTRAAFLAETLALAAEVNARLASVNLAAVPAGSDLDKCLRSAKVSSAALHTQLVTAVRLDVPRLARPTAAPVVVKESPVKAQAHAPARQAPAAARPVTRPAPRPATPAPARTAPPAAAPARRHSAVAAPLFQAP